ncbi:MAG: hypothetical protein JKY94_16835 [Rhodobacteraceae bacterium]|nr:hypothetical protein [Paracoccaceae bacterium]
MNSYLVHIPSAGLPELVKEVPEGCQEFEIGPIALGMVRVCCPPALARIEDPEWRRDFRTAHDHAVQQHKDRVAHDSAVARLKDKDSHE